MESEKINQNNQVSELSNQDEPTRSRELQHNLSDEFNNPDNLKRLRESHLDSPVSANKTPRLLNTPRLSHYNPSNRVSVYNLIDRRLEEHIRLIKSMWEERENILLTEINKLKRDVAFANERIDKFETVAGEIIEMKSQIQELKEKTLRQENLVVACDLRITNIPFDREENVYNIFDDICRTIDIQTPSIKAIYRLKNKNNREKQNSPDAAIVVNMLSPYDKNFVLKSISAYKKKTGVSQLKLSLIGFETDEPFYVYESLTLKNHKILLEAVKLKKNKCLHSAYSYRGLIYVKRLSTDQPIRIDYSEQLSEFFLAPSENRERSYTSGNM